MKKTIKLTESDMHKVIHESVNRILREQYEDELTNDPSVQRKLNALRELGIKLCHVKNGRMWFDDNTGARSWHINNILQKLDLSYLDEFANNVSDEFDDFSWRAPLTVGD